MSYKVKTDAERKEEVDKALEKIEKAIPDVYTSKNFRDYLKFLSSFHNYSINNIILIKMQNPNASLVAGYKTWQDKFERQVTQKGAIKILAPMKHKKLVEKPVKDEFGDNVYDEEGKVKTEKVEVNYMTYKLVNVFDVSQTEGKPLPSLTKELEGSDERARALIGAIQKISEFNIAFVGNEDEMIKHGAKGYFSKTFNYIRVKEDMSDYQTAKTLVHEYAHGILHQDSDKERSIKEVEAEATAYAVSDYFGINTGEYSFAYIAGWASEQTPEVLHDTLNNIQRNVNEIITKIEPEFIKELEYEKVLEEERVLETAFELSVEVPEQFPTKDAAINFVKEVDETNKKIGISR